MKLKALVAEDKPAQRQNIVECLVKDGRFQVIADFDDVNSCFNYIVGHPELDVLFLDIILFHGSAFHLLQQLKESKVPVPPVVIISAGNERDYVHETVNLYGEEIVFFIQKPFSQTWRLQCHECVSKIKISKIKSRNSPQVLSLDSGLKLKRLEIGGDYETKILLLEEIAWMHYQRSADAIYQTPGVYIYTTTRNEPFLERRRSLSVLKKRTEDDRFVAISREDVVNAEFIDGFYQEIGSGYRYAVLRLPNSPRVYMSSGGERRLKEILGL